MSEEKNEEKEYLVPGRISLEQVRKEQKELKEAKDAARIMPKSKKVLNAMSMFSIATDFGLIIALPLLVLAYVGKWLDNRYGTKYFILIGLVLAMSISVMGIYKQIKRFKELLKK
jgi:F0F1-type ATP synthase assembly protein I